MEEVRFRLARLSDFDEVMNLLGGIYKGRDYLPLEFHRWMKTEDFTVMVAAVGEKLVGLTAGFIADDGKTCIRRAARVLPEYRGRGVNKKLSQVLNEYVQLNFPSVIRVRFVTRYNDFSKNTLAKLKTIHHFEVLSYDIGEEAPYAKEKSQEISTIRIARCTKEYISDIIFSSLVGQQLVSNNVLI